MRKVTIYLSIEGPGDAAGITRPIRARDPRSEFNTNIETTASFRLHIFYFQITCKSELLTFLKTKNPQLSLWVSFCGERGIRTPGGVTLNSFQDCRIRPLCHFSLADANIETFFNTVKGKLIIIF